MERCVAGQGRSGEGLAPSSPSLTPHTAQTASRMAESGSETFTLNIKAPADQRFSVTVPASSTVEQLKEEVRPRCQGCVGQSRRADSALCRPQIAKAKEDFPVDQQRVRTPTRLHHLPSGRPR